MRVNIFPLKVLAVITIFFTSLPLNAQTQDDLDSFTLWATTNGDNLIRIISSPRINPDSCSNSDSYFVSTSLPDEAIARIYSTLLAAKISGKPVSVTVQGCEQDRPKIIDVRLL